MTASTTGAIDATFMVNLTHTYNQTVTVEYATADDTAKASEDYVGVPRPFLLPV